VIRLRRFSLGARMVLVFGALLGAIGVFMLVFFPARMAEQAREQAEQRVTSIAQVMSTAIAPAIEFDDKDNAESILGWLATARDARFGLVRDEQDRRFAVWHPESVPTSYTWHDHAEVDVCDDLLIVTIPIRGVGGASGTLHLGFSLEQLAAEHEEAQHTVALASTLVVAIGLLATTVLAAFVVRQIRRLSTTARKIASGRLPPVMPEVSGGDEVTELASALHAMLERVNAESQQELVRASRHAGMAEVATGVLHNVGNVLTSVNVSLQLLRERTSAMPVERLRKLEQLLGSSGSSDAEKLALTRRYLAVMTGSLEQFRAEATRDLDAFDGHIDHIKRVVAMQNAYARLRNVTEPTSVTSLIHEAIELGCSPQRRPDISVTVEIAPELEATMQLDRHHMLQILVNLVSNARDAVSGSSSVRVILVKATREQDKVVIAVSDNGIGIGQEALARIFTAGFTSKPHGHGYGLHSAALTARQLGGSLEVWSAGEGRGARFTLTVPIEEST
jgi:signal transduction histidine kinase